MCMLLQNYFSRANFKKQNQGIDKASKAGFYMANRPDIDDGEKLLRKPK